MATSVGTISSAGIGSGLDVSGIVSKLVSLESRPLTLLQNQSSAVSARLSSYGKLQSNFAGLQDKANALTSTSLWTATTATVSDAAALAVTTGVGVSAGSYAVKVDRLAVGQTLSSTAFASGSTNLGEGSLTIELGSYTGGTTPGFAAKSGSTALRIDIDADHTSLAAIRDKINAADAGVVAAIITDAAGARLSLRSKDTGNDSAFRITATEVSEEGSPPGGLSALAYDANDGASKMTRHVAAANAELSINGIAISSASNTLDNVVEGLSLSLKATSSAATMVNVATDTAAIKAAITGFVSAFNNAAGFIKSQTAYNADSKSGGVLQGDPSALSLQSQLRAVINTGSSASSAWSRLSDIGIALKSDGTLNVDDTKLSNAVGNPAELKKLLATDGVGDADSGFARRFKRVADAALGAGGLFESRSSGLQARITRLGKDQDAMQLRINQTEARLRAQYSSLDTKMAQLNGLSTYMTQQLAQFNRSG